MLWSQRLCHPQIKNIEILTPAGMGIHISAESLRYLQLYLRVTQNYERTKSCHQECFQLSTQRQKSSQLKRNQVLEI